MMEIVVEETPGRDVGPPTSPAENLGANGGDGGFVVW